MPKQGWAIYYIAHLLVSRAQLVTSPAVAAIALSAVDLVHCYEKAIFGLGEAATTPQLCASLIYPTGRLEPEQRCRGCSDSGDAPIDSMRRNVGG